MVTKCIICGDRKSGLPVRIDGVIGVIRWFKRNVSKNEQGNTLVVCKDDYVSYKKARDRYVFRQRFYLGVGLLLSATGLFFSHTLQTIFVAIFLLAFLYTLSLLSYMPALLVDYKVKKPKKAAT